MSKSLIEYIYQYEKERPNQAFLNQPFGDRWEAYTWAETCDKARRLASWLKKTCGKEKAHIGLVSKNCREWVIADIAIMMAGYVSVPFYPNLKGKELQAVLELGDVDLLLVGKVENWEDMQIGVAANMPIGKFPHYKGNPVIDRGTDWAEIMAEAPLEGDVIPDQDDTWSIIFTSGTTGTPKGAMFKHHKLADVISMPLTDYYLKLDPKQDNRFFSYLPANHIAERVNSIMAMRFAAEVYFAESLETFAKNLQEASPTFFVAVPRILTKFKQGVLAKMPQEKMDKMLRIPILNNIVRSKIKKALGLDKSRMVICGAAPLTANDVKWWVKLGIPLSETYGQTETFAFATYAPVGGMKPGKVGMPHEGMEMKIAEDSNEILLKSPILMNGYYKDPERTAETIRDGWLHTGDAGKLHEDGYYSITGRVKDTFKTEKGKYIIPNKVEERFSLNTDIEQMCLLGLGMPQPVMVVVPSDNAGKKSKEELHKSLEGTLNSVNQDLPNYTRVSTIVVANEAFTPENGLLTPTMKVKRFNVHEKYVDKLRDFHEDAQAVVWEG
ncbi:MAG: AMP-binding protein [Bacteroidota bacterium]